MPKVLGKWLRVSRDGDYVRVMITDSCGLELTRDEARNLAIQLKIASSTESN